MTYVLVSSGSLRGLGADAPAASVADILAQSEELLNRLNLQRMRIAGEVELLKQAKQGGPMVFPPLIPFQILFSKLDLLEFQARIDSMTALRQATEDFVSDVYNRVEAQAKDPSKDESTRLAAAKRLFRATANILRAVGDTSPIDDLAADIKEAVNGVIRDGRDALNPNEWKIPVWVYGLGILAGLYYTTQILGSLKGPSKQG